MNDFKHPNPPLEVYEDESHRKRRKTQRRRETLKQIAIAAGWSNWSEYETAVAGGYVTIPPKPKTK